MAALPMRQAAALQYSTAIVAARLDNLKQQCPRHPLMGHLNIGPPTGSTVLGTSFLSLRKLGPGLGQAFLVVTLPDLWCSSYEPHGEAHGASWSPAVVPFCLRMRPGPDGGEPGKLSLLQSVDG